MNRAIFSSSLLWIACRVLIGLPSMAAAELDEEGFVPIFNGRDLDGWEGKPGWWKVEDGAITAESTADKPCKRHNYLMWRGGQPADFELRLEYRITGGNSGIQFRSRELPDWDTRGYQADLEAGDQWSGALFEHERGGIAMRGEKVAIAADGTKEVTNFADSAALQAHIRKDEWNTYRIVARGAEIRLYLNDRLMSHAIDRQDGKAARKGVLALQMHPGPPMKVQFRNLRLKEFPSSGARATAAEQLRIADGFQIDLLYSPDKQTEGSWVAMCVDPQGRLIVGNQYDEGLFRVTLPTVDSTVDDVVVEKIDLDFSGVQGLAWMGDSLYGLVSMNGKTPSGLYRLRDTDGDDRLDKVELLRALEGGGDHGWHGIVPAPGHEWLYLVGGNNTRGPRDADSRVPPLWSEDHLLPRLPDARGHMKGLLAPGGCIYRVDPDGRRWERIASGFRNPYDLAFNLEGELFAYDADMEWDMNTPWYRPTRVCHVVSGAEFGWRNGSGKWPASHPDSVPPALETGPGSPTGITFGYGAHFPPRYRDALFLGDWSYGRVHAAHLAPDGASYRGESELILSGTPFPVTDLVVNPKDGALYIVTGGWRIQSGLYRLTHRDGSDRAEDPQAAEGAQLRATRHALEAFHGRRDPRAVEEAWKWLGHSDRFLRFAARVVLEWQDPATWHDQALAERDPQASLTALLALVRVSGRDEFHRDATDLPPDPALQRRVIGALEQLGWDTLDDTQRLELVRVCSLALIRLGDPHPGTRERLQSIFETRFPTRTRTLNSELCALLVYLDSPTVARKALALVEGAPTQEEQLDYVKSLRVLKTGWTPELRSRYFSWFQRAASYRGGASFQGFLDMIRKDAIDGLNAEEKMQLQALLEEPSKDATGEFATEPILAGRSTVKDWKVEDLAPLLERATTGRDLARGRRLFGATGCFACHRYAGEGGAMGPDLTGAGRRFSPRDLLETILDPGRTVSDLYGNSIMRMQDGKTVMGRIVYLGEHNVQVNIDMFNPAETVRLDRRQIASIEPSPVSPMPTGLLNRLHEDEILDLLGYLLAGENAAGQ